MTRYIQSTTWSPGEPQSVRDTYDAMIRAGHTLAGQDEAGQDEADDE